MDSIIINRIYSNNYIGPTVYTTEQLDIKRLVKDASIGVNYYHNIVGQPHNAICPHNIAVTSTFYALVHDTYCNKSDVPLVYKSPEELKNQKGSFIASDIWSLGITLIECILEKPVFNHSEPVNNLMLKHIDLELYIPNIGKDLQNYGFLIETLHIQPSKRIKISKLLNYVD